MTRPEPINCYRCGQPGYVNWIDVTTYADPEPRYVLGKSWCVTPGCTDEDGSRRLQPLTVEELRHRADVAFERRHKMLTEDR